MAHKVFHHVPILLPLSFLVVNLIWICTSCEPKTHENQEYNSAFQLVLKDSLEVSVRGRLFIYDYLPQSNLYLASLSTSEEVILFDGQGKISGRFDKSGKGPGYFEGEVKGLTYLGDTAFVVLAQRGYFTYDLNGQHLKTIFHPSHAPYNFRKGTKMEVVSCRDSLYLLSDFKLVGNYPIYDPRFFHTTKNFTALSLVSERYEGRIPFLPNGMYTSSAQEYIPAADHFYAYQASASNLWVLSESERKISLYDLNDSISFLRQYDTSPRYMKQPMRRPSGAPVSSSFDQYDREVMASSKYRGIWNRDDTLLTMYRAGADIDMFEQTLLEEYQDNFHRLSRNYFQLFVGGKKISRDILMPLKVRALMYMNSTQHLLFSPEDREMKQEPEGSRMYIYALKQVETSQSYD